MYLIPVKWSDDPNEDPKRSSWSTLDPASTDLHPLEAKFQFSFKLKLWQGLLAEHIDLWAGYTQTSWIQIYGPRSNTLFRETNYEPEAVVVIRTPANIGNWRFRAVALGINHQSNGRDGLRSRSWDRLFAMIGLDHQRWFMLLRPWVRIPQRLRWNENPEIEDHVGRLDLVLAHQSRSGHELSVLLRHSLLPKPNSRGAVQVDWAVPIGAHLMVHFQMFHGYGESLIDHNHPVTAVGAGLSLTNWRGS